MKHTLWLPAALLATSTLAAAPQGDTPAAWPTWRGPDATGYAANQAPPTTWSETENIKWKVAVPGLGISSPIIWRDRIFLTTAVATDRPGQADATEPQDRRAQPRPTVIHEFAVLALDRRDGSVVWRTVVAETVPHEGGHSTNSHASGSPVTDGEHLFVNFGSRGLHCLDLSGNVVWSVDLGRMQTLRQYGEGSSPAVFGDRLVVNHDHEGDSFIAVFDKRTGDEIWRRSRDEVTSWSTPLVLPVDGRPQIVVNATTASRGYDLASGDVIWHLAGMTVNCIPSPVHRDGLVYLMSGYRGRALQAVRLAGAHGDLAGTDNVAWAYHQRVSYVPSALLYGDCYYFMRGNTGVLTCLDAATGEPHFDGQKLEHVRSVYASPVGAGGHVYVTSRDGVTQVLKHGHTFETVAANRLDDDVDASLAIVDNEIYVRGREHLYCIAHTDKVASGQDPDPPASLFDSLGPLGPATELTASLSTGDLDGDGDLDIVVANGRHWPGQNKVFLNDGKGGFSVERNLGTPSKSYAVPLADLDGDGDLDAVVGNDREPSRIFWNDGKANFTDGGQVGQISSTRSVILADLDGANGPDIVFTNRGQENLICFNDGKGGFARQATFGGRRPTVRTAAGDIDGDGDLDLAVASLASEPDHVFLNDGSGGFAERRDYGTRRDATRGVALVDINGDGNLDIVTANIGRPNAIYFGDGEGGFPHSIEIGDRVKSYGLATADMDADGRLDVVIANAGAANAVWLQQPDGSFTEATFGAPSGITYDVIAADWTGDGRPEMATANSGGANYVFGRSRANGTRSLFNGSDLTGWHADVPKADSEPDLPPSFVAERGLLVSRGKPRGHLITDASFRDYRLHVEYRWPGKPGNCGILVHASKKRMLYKMFPQSMECQLHNGNAGDFWCIGEDIAVPDMEKRRGPKEKWGVTEGKARRIRNLTDNSEKPPGEWNTMVIECRGSKIDIWVNGDHVNNGSGCTADHGQIAIQAEGAACEFRKIELTPLVR